METQRDDDDDDDAWQLGVVPNVVTTTAENIRSSTLDRVILRGRFMLYSLIDTL